MVFSNKIWRQNQARTFDNKKQLIMKTRHVTIKTNKLRPLQNIPFCPITASGSNFNPRNIQYIPPVEIFAFLVLEQN